MPVESRPMKRPREDEPRPETPLTRSPDYWLEDGSIVLQVEATQFRVAKTMLAMHSTVFKDMPSLPPADEPLIEGCPVVVLPGDKAADWKHLLDLMYPKTGFFDAKEDVPHFDSVAAVLRLSKKYDIPSFRKRCVARLKTTFPASLTAFDVKSKSRLWSEIHVGPGDDDWINFLIQTVHLARDAGLSSILPSVFYTLVMAETANPGALAKVSSPHIAPSPVSHLQFQIPAADELTLLKGHQNMANDFGQGPMRWIDSAPAMPLIPCDTCSQSQTCQSTMHYYRGYLLSAHATSLPQLLIIFPAHIETRLCTACFKTAKNAHHAGRTDSWERLPSYFGLPPWEELLKSDIG
ncbi:BTB domain-containing protein [Mycena kentingensis (nom. inval.)]|nr:BTB domain-containing protein [Mycena kentingensis (nom. inval.)]